MFKTFWNRWILSEPGHCNYFIVRIFYRGGHGSANWIAIHRFGQTSLTGDVVAIALVRELGRRSRLAGDGPVRNGDRFGARVDAGNRAVDAMRAMGTNPSRKLVTPRLLAALLMVRC